MASFSDDFNRADSTDLGSGWVQVSGAWSIVSGQLSPGASGATVVLRAAGAMASSDHYAQVTIAATTGVSQGVWCRGDATFNNGYLWRNSGTSWDLFRVVSGAFTNIGTYAVAVAAGDVMKVQAVGSTITGYVNGVQRVSVTDTSVPTGTSVGLRVMSTSGLRFDNFAAADVVTGATLGVATATEAAQALIGAKTAPLAVAGTVETAQPLPGSKTLALGTALATATAQAPAGTKTAPLPVAAQTETAQPLAVAKSWSLGTAAAVETAQPLTGTKTATLNPAVETSTARPLATAGTPGLEIDISVGTPYSPWAAWTAPERWTAVDVPAPWAAKEAP